MKDALLRLIASMKFWTAMLGLVTALAARYGFSVDPEVYWTIVGIFGALLGGQALTDHGKEAAKANKLNVLLLLAVVGMLGCAATAREKTLRAALVTTTTAEAGFVSWDRDHQFSLLGTPDAREQVTKYRERRVAVTKAFATVYRAIAAAALTDSEADFPAALSLLRVALHDLTGGKL